MADKQHMIWFREGVEAWNARRRADPNLKPNLSFAKLRRADLDGADLRDADLRRANLGGADLSGADLRGADLRGADLRGSDLKAADLRGVDLRNADLSESIHLTQRQVDSARGDKGTKIPLYPDRPAHWDQDADDEGADQEGDEVPEEPPQQAEAQREEGDDGAPAPAEGVPDPADELSEQSDPVAVGALRSQVSILLAEPTKALEAVAPLYKALDTAIAMVRQANPGRNDWPRDFQIAEDFTAKLGEIEVLLRANANADAPNQSIENALQQKLADQERRITDLTNELMIVKAELVALGIGFAPDTMVHRFKSAFATTLGMGTAAMVLGAAEAILGSYGLSAIGSLRDALIGLGQATPIATPNSATPPTVGV